jgi:predicted amidohydrolase YtcJ
MKIIHNARVYTLDPALPVATALAIDSGRIIAVGGEELLSAGSSGDHEDMGGSIILPGFVDAHIHLQEYALAQQVVDCNVPTRQEILHRVAERAGETPAGEWVRGHGWNQNIWGGEWPSAVELDVVTPNHPVFLTAKSLHVAWLNTAALKKVGIGPDTPDPANGSYQRYLHGVPTGIVFEEALKFIEAAIPEPAPELLAQTFQQLIPDLMSMGLTGAHDFDKRNCFRALEILHGHGDLHFRVVKSIPLNLLSQGDEIGLQSGFGDDILRIGSVKLFADGALGPHTAAMFDAYVDEPQNRGILILNAEKLFEYGRQAATSGLSLAVHAIGDRAVHEGLDGFAKLRAYERERNLPALRHRMEHVQTVRPEDAERLAKMGIIASIQPVHVPSDMFVADRILGERAKFSHAWRSQLECGVRFAFGSDAPVESPNPFFGIHAAVTRRRQDGSPGPDGWFPQQRLTLASALEGFTSGPAYAAGMEDRLGRLSVGYLADMIVIANDPFTCEPEELYTIRPTATMVAGDWVWRS